VSEPEFGGIELLDTISVSGSSVQSVVFGAGGDGAQGRALDGDADGEYILICNMRHTAPGFATYFGIRPNGLVTNQSGNMSTIVNAGHVLAGPLAFMGIGRIESAGVKSQLRVEIMAAAGRARLAHSQGITPVTSCYGFGIWSDTSTKITSLVVHCEEGAFIDAGSEFQLFRRGVWL